MFLNETALGLVLMNSYFAQRKTPVGAPGFLRTLAGDRFLENGGNRVKMETFLRGAGLKLP